MPEQAHEACLAHSRELLALLDQEQRILQQGEAEALAAVCTAKAEQLRQLYRLLPALKSGPAAARRELQELVSQCQQRTRANEVLLNARMKRSRNALLAWRGAPGHYDGRGRGQYEAQQMMRSVA